MFLNRSTSIRRCTVRPPPRRPHGNVATANPESDRFLAPTWTCSPLVDQLAPRRAVGRLDGHAPIAEHLSVDISYVA